MNKEIILLLGASGAGKTTLLQTLKDIDIPELISDTTRKPRDGEINGITYNFVTEREFDFNGMIEYTNYNGNYYGTSRCELRYKLNLSNKVCVICERHGAEEFKKIYGNAVKVIYIYAPIEDMVRHMRDRGDKEENIMNRVINAVNTKELDNIDIADYVIVNKNLDKSVKLLKNIVEM